MNRKALVDRVASSFERSSSRIHDRLLITPAQVRQAFWWAIRRTPSKQFVERIPSSSSNDFQAIRRTTSMARLLVTIARVTRAFWWAIHQKISKHFVERLPTARLLVALARVRQAFWWAIHQTTSKQFFERLPTADAIWRAVCQTLGFPQPMHPTDHLDISKNAHES
jgi:nitrogen fixation-related uncharacterized protein